MPGTMMMKRPMMKKGGKALKKVKPSQKGLRKLPANLTSDMGMDREGVTIPEENFKTSDFDYFGSFARGGRVGYRKGTPKKQTNIQKIKKTFGPKSSLGMQSVIYGLDKNPDITKADPKAKFIAAANKKKKNKKVIG